MFLFKLKRKIWTNSADFFSIGPRSILYLVVFSHALPLKFAKEVSYVKY